MLIKPIHYSFPILSKIKDKTLFFEQIKNTFTEIKNSGIFNDKAKKTIFIYRIKTKSKVYHGIIAGIDIQEYIKGKIKKHENTLIKQEENIIQLMKARQAIIKPVLLAYPSKKKIKDLIVGSFLGKKPKFVIEFPKEHQIHELFAVTKIQAIKDIQKAFKAQVPKAYIADGHHRMAAVNDLLLANPDLKSQGLNYFLCALFDFNELSIFSYNRLVHILDLFDIDVILAQLSKVAQVKKIPNARQSSKKFEIILFTSNAYYSIVWNKSIIAKVKKEKGIVFDIDLFNDYILQEIMGIEDIRSNPRITYVEGVKGTKSIIKSIKENKEFIGFGFYPVKRGEFIKIADDGKVLPPKSTWFEPRIKNGLVIQHIEGLLSA